MERGLIPKTDHEGEPHLIVLSISRMFRPSRVETVRSAKSTHLRLSVVVLTAPSEGVLEVLEYM